MKTLVDVKSLLSDFENKYKFPVVEAQQGSEVWFKLKLGVVSASNAHKAVAKRDSETRLTYMSELVAQVCTGIIEEVNSKHMDWGHLHEDAARSCYEFESGSKVTELPFVFKDNLFREGCSPDGFVSTTKGVEIKCPYNSAHFIKFFTDDKVKPEYQWQCQFTLRVLGADEWDFTNYDPRMRKGQIKTLTIKRDAEKQQVFDDFIPLFIEDMDKMLSKIGIKFGEQWT